VQPAEAGAMSLVSKHTFVPVPNVFFTKFGPDHGHIGMTLIPGSCLGEKWDTLDGKSRKSVCLQIWDLLSMIRAIPRPPKLEVFVQCAANGSLKTDRIRYQDIQDIKDLHKGFKIQVHKKSRHCLKI
jgi:hypothetical protein